MKLSPLRKEVQSLNKDLESQNIQIRDLIKFLNKSTPKQAFNQQKSPCSNIQRLFELKNSFSQDKVYKIDDEKKPKAKEFRESKSMKYLKPFQAMKNQYEANLKQITMRQTPMTKSVTFHNIQNALTTRKYLKLSRPEKKTNASCSFCRQSTFASHTITDCSKLHKVSSRKDTVPKLSKSKHFVEDNQSSSRIKKSTDSKSKPKIKQKINSDQKAPLRQLGSNEILSKNEVKSFFDRKSNKMKNQLAKSKAKLEIKDQKSYKNSFLTKR